MLAELAHISSFLTFDQILIFQLSQYILLQILSSVLPCICLDRLKVSKDTSFLMLVHSRHEPDL